MDPQHHTGTGDFPTISYRRTGSGPALMLLHGFPANGALWEPVVAELSKHATLLIPDLPGTGTSVIANAGTLRIEGLAAIVPAILEHAGIDGCVVAGHSMGGYVALAALEKYPDSIRGLSLVHSSAAADDEAKKEKRAKSIALIDNGGREHFIKGMIPGLFAPSFAKSHPDVMERWTEEGLKLSAQTLTAFYRAMMDRPDRTEVLRNSPVPVQFILGAVDETIPPESVIPQTPLPAIAFVERYADTAHMGMIEQPEMLAGHLAGFVCYCS